MITFFMKFKLKQHKVSFDFKLLMVVAVVTRSKISRSSLESDGLTEVRCETRPIRTLLLIGSFSDHVD